MPASLMRTMYPDPVGPQAGSQFGWAVAADVNYQVVGAPGATAGGIARTGQAFVYSATTGALLTTLNNPTATDLDDFGAAVAVSGNVVAVGNPHDEIGGINCGTAYLFNAATGALIATLNNPTPAAYDYFGISVAISGNTVVVGASQDDTGQTDSGAAYEFDASTGAFIRAIANPTPAPLSYFGSSVAISGNNIVVGATGYDNVGVMDNIGIAYVFNAATGALSRTLFHPSPAGSDSFGAAVAVSGNTAVVGAPLKDSAFVDSGAAYIMDTVTGNLISALNNPTPDTREDFGIAVAIAGNTAAVGAQWEGTLDYRSGTAYTFNAATGAPIATLNNPMPSLNDSLGCSVAILGNAVVVGALYDDTQIQNTGSAFVFDATTGSVSRTLINPTAAEGDAFGYSVAMSGSTVVVGAKLDDSGASFSGAAYVLNAVTGATIAKLLNPSPANGDHFGASVAVSGSLAVVGAPDDDVAGTIAGSAYVFDTTTGALIATLNNPTPAANDQFGLSVAVSGNIAVVGAPHDGSTFSNAGSAYLFNATTGALLATLNGPTPASGDYFGIAVAASFNLVVVTAYARDQGVYKSGAAYTFDATTGALIATLAHPAPLIGDYLGSSVAISGNIAVVGAAEKNTGAEGSGAAFAFNATTGAMLATFNNPTPEVGDKFGSTVAVSGNMVVVGAGFDDTINSDAGSAYLFDASTGALLATIKNPSPAGSDRFGCSVAVSGSTAIIGAFQDDAQNTDQGAAYVYSTVNAPPTIGAIGHSPDPVFRPGNMTLTASNAVDPDGPVARVQYYRDANANGVFEAGTDTLLGESTSAASNWSLVVATTTLTVGKNTIFARSQDPLGLYSNPASTVISVIPGRASIIARNSANGAWQAGVSNGTSFSDATWGFWTSSVSWVDVRTGDFNGDGIQDVAGRNQATGAWSVGLSNGSSLTTSTWGKWSVGAGVTWVDVQVGDFNNDGIDDLIGRWNESGQWWAASSNGVNFNNVYFGSWSAGVTWADVKVGDLNNDGRDDIVGRWNESGQWWAGVSNGAAFTNNYWGAWSTGVTWTDVQVGDFNGDHRADIVGRWKESGQWWVGQSTGTGIQNRYFGQWTASLTWKDVRVGDFDGDGLDDVMGRWQETGSWYLARSNGSAFSNQQWGTWSASIAWFDVVAADFNGDGKADIAGRDSQTGQWRVNVATAAGSTTSIWTTWSAPTTWADTRAAKFA